MKNIFTNKQETNFLTRLNFEFKNMKYEKYILFKAMFGFYE